MEVKGKIETNCHPEWPAYSCVVALDFDISHLEVDSTLIQRWISRLPQMLITVFPMCDQIWTGRVRGNLGPSVNPRGKRADRALRNNSRRPWPSRMRLQILHLMLSLPSSRIGPASFFFCLNWMNPRTSRAPALGYLRESRVMVGIPAPPHTPMVIHNITESTPLLIITTAVQRPQLSFSLHLTSKIFDLVMFNGLTERTRRNPNTGTPC